MCGGTSYQHEGEEIRTFFPNPRARLPVITRGGDSRLVTWGRRSGEGGSLPLGGWARLESIKSGRWNRWQPRPVRLALNAFMEKDIEGRSHWFPLTEGQWVQGLLARQGGELRVYVVTITPQMPDAVHERWPRIVSARD